MYFDDELEIKTCSLALNRFIISPLLNTLQFYPFIILFNLFIELQETRYRNAVS